MSGEYYTATDSSETAESQETRPEAGRARPPLRTTLIVLAIVVGLFALLYFWRAWMNYAPPPAAPPPTTVVATIVRPVQVPVALEAVGSLRAVREVMLAPEIAGRVTTINFSGGERVGAGAPLVQLFDGPERADRAAAVAKARFARLQLTRSRELVPSGAESREMLQQRQAEYDSAQAAVAQLDARLVQKRISAPFSGSIGVRRINRGQYLNPGDEIASLTDLSQLFVDFSVPQQELSKLSVGSEVMVTSDAWPGRRFTARVATVEPRIAEDSRNVLVRGIMANADGALRPGMFIRAALSLPPMPAALVVPTTALVTSAQGDSVLVVRGANASREGKAEMVSVITGRRFGDSVVITKGVKSGDVVVTEGQLRVQPGAMLKVARLLPAAGR